MAASTASIIRAASRPPTAAINICLLACAPETNDLIFETGHHIYSGAIPISVDIDLVVCPHEEDKVSAARQHSSNWQCPIACFYEDLPLAGWLPKKLEYARSFGGNTNFYTTPEALVLWGREESPQHRVTSNLRTQLAEIKSGS